MRSTARAVLRHAVLRHAVVRTLLAAATVGSAVALAPNVAHAQPPQGGGGGRGGAAMQAMLFEGITLTAAQQTTLDSIQTAYRAQNQAERQAQGGAAAGGRPDQATMDARRARMEAQRAALRAVLTADQQTVFDKNVAEMAKRMQERRGGGRR